jgi:hypothetical protein
MAGKRMLRERAGPSGTEWEPIVGTKLGQISRRTAAGDLVDCVAL